MHYQMPLNSNLFKVPLSEIGDTRAMEIIFEGEIAYNSGAII
ncbi:uncharacterized protein METZ01_LOCUS192213 [marine metagenome]|uniref:Uncharacterized protein n=1 Tax=marine metagenome TaxID=408172 RepID=A0A382DMD3_9ZZZZ